MKAIGGGTSTRSGLRVFRAFRRETRTGQAIVEFAVVSVAFFSLIFGTIDFGRAIYAYSELRGAVREGARYSKVNPAETTNIKNRIIEQSPELDLTYRDITVDCPGGCTAESTHITIEASYEFSAVTQDFLGIGPITLRSKANVEIE